METNQEPVTQLTEETKQELAANGLAQPGEVPPPTKQQQILSRKQFGEWRRATFTVKKPHVSTCQHSFSMQSPPTNNCMDCWYIYFTKCVDLELLHAQFRVDVGKTRSLYGDKYVKMFRRFIEIELAALHAKTITNPEAVPGAVAISDSVMFPDTKAAFEASVAENPELNALLAQGKEIIAEAKEKLNGIPEEAGSR